jgi:hypothetical protein
MGLLPDEIVRLLKLHQKTGGKKKRWSPHHS